MKPNGISGSAIFWKKDKYLCEYRKMTRFDPDSSHIFVYGKFKSIEGSYKDVIFAEAHLKAKKGNEEERVNQISKLIDFKRQTQQFFDDKYPIIIAGDFNDVPESESIQNLEEEFIDFYSLKDLNFTEVNKTTDYS